MEYTYKRVKEHWEVYCGGIFIASADTLEEAHQEAQEHATHILQ